MKLLLTIFLTAGICLANTNEFEQVIDAIHLQESSKGKTDKPMFPHNNDDDDGHGEYGTGIALLADINCKFKTDYWINDLRDPVKARKICGLGLILLKERWECKDFWQAAGRYHSPGNKYKRNEYIKKLKGEL